MNIKSIGMILLLGLWGQVLAEIPLGDERSSVQYLLGQVQHLGLLLKNYQDQKPFAEAQRLHFNFDAFLQDIKTLEQGIQAYLDYPSMRVIPAIEGDYLNWNGGWIDG